MSFQFDFIRNGRHVIRTPKNNESRAIRYATLAWFGHRGIPAKTFAGMKWDAIVERAFDHALEFEGANELRLPLEESCVWIRRAQQ